MLTISSVPKGALAIIQALHHQHHEAFLVGGCVRDLLRGVPPKDFDIVTSARPDEITQLFSKCVLVGEKFGVIRVPKFGKDYEVATFRKDMGSLDGRHPQSIIFCNAKEDVLRRDFTVNGLLYDVTGQKVLDFVHGQKDLDAHTIRCIGGPSKRFQEDHLRMMRAIRFACQLRFKLAPGVLDAIRTHAAKIQHISMERIRDEFSKILTGPQPKRGLMLLQNCGLLKEILPEAVAMMGVDQPAQFHKLGDVYNHTLGLLDLLRNPSLELAYACLLHDIGKPQTKTIRERIRFDGHVELGIKMSKDICRRLRLSSKQSQLICELVAQHMRFMDVQKMRESTLKRFLRIPYFKEHLELHRVDCLASHGDLSNYHFCTQKFTEYEKQSLENSLKPMPFLSGEELIQLGYQPGPIFRRILNRVETLQLEGLISTKTQAVDIILQEFPRTMNES